ncbi:hypothetical protein BBP40_001239 [Aspergillus hancockii]|nr:hypothetical protein BBP40_001239 [Aspergillus hancockii]
MELPQRIAMAPMTRYRADDAHVPLPIVKEYYEQRAAVPGTLIITEGTFISDKAGGYPNVPGIYNQDQISAWREVTDAVHAKGSYIYLQLWALGRTANPDYLKQHGHELVSSSATPMSTESHTPKELSESEIQQYIAIYANAAKNAVAAGFDGVEIHGANGYLIDQFIQDVSNKRTDAWGGSVEKRSKFALEVVRAVTEAIGADRTGIRLSPWSTFQGMRMTDPIPQFSYLAKELGKFKLAFLHAVESLTADFTGISQEDKLNFLIESYGKASPILIAGGYTSDSAKNVVDSKYKDHDIVIAFGRPFTSNPDLPFRIKNNVALRPYEREGFFTPKSPERYIDFDFSDEFKSVKVAA